MPAKPRLFIFGSYIVAMVMEVPRLPQPGETLTGQGFYQTHGGKGSNMVVQAARLGADVTFAGVIGHDASGDAFLATLAEEGISANAVRRSFAAPTGTGFIIVETGGRNVIVIDPGANLEFTPANDFARLKPLLAGCGAALAQWSDSACHRTARFGRRESRRGAHHSQSRTRERTDRLRFVRH